jgi:hypothetical protein
MSGVDNNIEEREVAREPRQDKKEGEIWWASMPRWEAQEAPIQAKDTCHPLHYYLIILPHSHILLPSKHNSISLTVMPCHELSLPNWQLIQYYCVYRRSITRRHRDVAQLSLNQGVPPARFRVRPDPAERSGTNSNYTAPPVP